MVLHDVSEKVTEEGRVFSQQCVEVKGAFGGDELGQANLTGGKLRPLRHTESVFRVWAFVADCLENHGPSIWPDTARKPVMEILITQTNESRKKGTPRVPVRARGPLLPSGPGGVDEVTPHEGSANTVRGARRVRPAR